MIERLVDYLPERADHVLELGCGTGNLSLELADRYPSASLTLVDAAPEMLEVASRRLRAKRPASAKRARFLLARFEDITPDAGAYDVVTSCISLHHVVDKAALYTKLIRALAPAGTLRFADQLRGATSANHDCNWTRWLEFCRQPGNASDKEIDDLVEHSRMHDHYTPLREHFRLLEAAGFTAVDCVWRNWIWGIVTADRP
jgi:tRNA (cmo5U34)-methyltransferase